MSSMSARNSIGENSFQESLQGLHRDVTQDGGQVQIWRNENATYPGQTDCRH